MCIEPLGVLFGEVPIQVFCLFKELGHLYFS